VLTLVGSDGDVPVTLQPGKAGKQAAGAPSTIMLSLRCSDGELHLPLHVGGEAAEAEYHLGLSVACVDGLLPLDIVIDTTDGGGREAALSEKTVVQTLFLNTTDGVVRLRLNLNL